ncbi:hypothetical protein EDEG_03019 [Edhazardia aedis USNM 41457]|uniref:Uncharacterized protein n=1 Tax=Edhazardia aedis (strain USNM 41457) TaxID=1003232 RepID=J9DMK8_EDHAE|nr:hypothetical protein EDEG_03019 [Edhazardia aedis USNM 41457]|eukprot:EJW02572.1 hypothetical protein EDEG_03019 [Edhazardia aedis USNM 41457]
MLVNQYKEFLVGETMEITNKSESILQRQDKNEIDQFDEILENADNRLFNKFKEIFKKSVLDSIFTSNEFLAKYFTEKAELIKFDDIYEGYDLDNEFEIILKNGFQNKFEDFKNNSQESEESTPFVSKNIKDLITENFSLVLDEINYNSSVLLYFNEIFEKIDCSDQEKWKIYENSIENFLASSYEPLKKVKNILSKKLLNIAKLNYLQNGLEKLIWPLIIQEQNAICDILKKNIVIVIIF